jgi:hypothetical protein
MISFSLIRSDIYKHNLAEYGDSFINLRSPYTYIKSIYYMETASFFLFITQSTIKSPNFVTFLYMLTGVIGAFLLNSSQEILFYIGTFMVFTKGTFDWADGPLARRLNKTSFLGHALDCYGAYISDIAFRVAFVYYSLINNPDFMGMFPVFVFILMAPDLRLFTDVQYLKRITGVNSSSSSTYKIARNSTFEQDLHDTNGVDGKLKKWYFRYTSFLDGRARSIDFLLLVLVIDSLYGYSSLILLILSILILLRSITLYIAGAYFISKVYKE